MLSWLTDVWNFLTGHCPECEKIKESSQRVKDSEQSTGVDATAAADSSHSSLRTETFSEIQKDITDLLTDTDRGHESHDRAIFVSFASEEEESFLLSKSEDMLFHSEKDEGVPCCEGFAMESGAESTGVFVGVYADYDTGAFLLS
ncbi:MAG: hypothetical protein FD149_1595 [Rhodospirillaceae bacterium]|nr:MAG: hypothetical protein FD149_1595 [Rhodospirillaceae bacterium]